MNEIIILSAVFVFQIILPLAVLFFLLSELISIKHGAPYVPVPKKSIRKILSFGELAPEDILYDLGCGDGRVIMSGVLNFQVSTAVGYEVSPWAYLKLFLSTKNVEINKSKIEIHRKNALKADLEQVTFIYLYLFPKLVDKLAKKIAREAKPDTKVLSVSFPIDTVKHPEFQLFKSDKISDLTLYLYKLNPHNSLIQ